jgi:hypothetical protein
MEATAIIALVLGIVSLMSTILLVGVWKGRIEADVSIIKKELEKYNIAEIASEVHTLWEVYVVDAMRSHPNLAQQHSPLKITEEGINEIPPEIQQALEKFPVCHTENGDIPAWDAVKCLGLPVIQQVANTKGWTLQKTIALLGLYLKKLEEDHGKK